MTRARIFTTTAIVLASIVVASVAAQPVSAQTGSLGGRPANPDASNSRTQSIFIKKIDAGQTVTDAVEVTNNADTAQRVLVYPTDSVVSSGGAFACAQYVDVAEQVGSWIKFEAQSFELPAKTSRDIPFTLTAPAGAEPGEHDGCIVIQEETSSSAQGGIALNFRTAIRVAVLINGDVNKNLTADGLRVNETASKLIATPVITNDGNVSVDADITVRLVSVLGTSAGEQKSTYPVLRAQTGEFNFELDKPFWGGFYRVSYEVMYDRSSNFLGETSQPDFTILDGQRVTVFVTPHPLAFIAEFLLLVLLAVGIYFTAVGLRRRKLIETTWRNYTVKHGDTLQKIAKRYSIEWRQLARVNRLKAPYDLQEEQVLRVPGPVQEKPRAKRHGKA